MNELKKINSKRKKRSWTKRDKVTKLYNKQEAKDNYEWPVIQSIHRWNVIRSAEGVQTEIKSSSTSHLTRKLSGHLLSFTKHTK